MIAIIVLLIIAGLANGLMDTLSYHFVEGTYLYKFKSKWFDSPDKTWKNKYKNYPEDKSPKYWGATTFLSFTTDAWHFFKFVQLQAFKLIVVLLLPINITGVRIADAGIAFIGATIAIATGFHFTYTFLKRFL